MSGGQDPAQQDYIIESYFSEPSLRDLVIAYLAALDSHDMARVHELRQRIREDVSDVDSDTASSVCEADCHDRGCGPQVRPYRS